MSTPYFTPIPTPTPNTPWQGPNYLAKAMAFEQAFIFEMICSWCGDHIRGPVGGPKTSHGICTTCRDKQIKAGGL